MNNTNHPKEARMQEIKRCLDRATELGGATPEAYDLTVDDFRYMYDKLMKVREYTERIKNGNWIGGHDIRHIANLIDND